MNAAEARQKATEVLTNNVDSEYAIIKKMIGEAVSRGDFECWVFNTAIRQEVKAKLCLEGYCISPTQTDRNETSTQITW